MCTTLPLPVRLSMHEVISAKREVAAARPAGERDDRGLCARQLSPSRGCRRGSPLPSSAIRRLHAYLSERFGKNGSTLVRAGFINGLPGFVTLEADGELQTTALEIMGGKVTAIYVVRNPDKLRHLH